MSGDEKSKVDGMSHAPPDFDWRKVTPDDSPKTPMDVMAEPRTQDLVRPKFKQGDPAYGFSGQIYDFSDGTPVVTGKSFDLLTAAGERPVALIFGSYT